MPTDVKLNAEDLPDSFLDQLRTECQWECGEKVIGKQTLWHIIAELQYRRTLANSKPTPSVGDDGLVERLRRLYPHNHMDGSPTDVTLAIAAIAAAHSQHEADVARIGELTEALRRIVSCHDTNHEHQREKLADIIPIARSAHAKVKP